MKRILIALWVCTSAYAWELPIVEVIDGDTIKTEIVCMPKDLRTFSIREQATELTKSIALGNERMTVTDCKHDKFGGRLDCNVEINGIDVATTLIQHGLAREYWGEKKKSWCETN